MKFLIDAQLPPSLKKIFLSNGYDCLHTLDLELKNDTPDSVINFLSVSEKRVVITKDADFLESFILKKHPYKLILVKLGNTSKKELLDFFTEKLNEIVEQIKSEDLIILKKSNSQ